MVTAFVRTLILYFVIVFGLRLMGKRQIGELEPSELVLALVISDLASVPMQDFGIPLLNGVLPIIVLLSISMIISILNLKSIRFRTLMCGESCTIISEGKILQENMRLARFTVDELIQELRQQGITDLSTVKYAVLETNGKLSVLMYSAFQPATPKSLNLPSEDSVTLPYVLICDGRLIDANLKKYGCDKAFVEMQIKLHGADNIRDVFLMTIDSDGKTFFLKKEI